MGRLVISPSYFSAIFFCSPKKALLSLLLVLELCIQMGISFFLLCLLLLFFSLLIVRPPQTIILPFCNSFSWRWSWLLPPLQCHKLPSIVLQALCLSDLILWIYLSLPLYNNKGFDLGHTLNGLVVFPTFFNLSLNFAIRSFQFKPEFCNKEFMIWATVSSQPCFS